MLNKTSSSVEIGGQLGKEYWSVTVTIQVLDSSPLRGSLVSSVGSVACSDTTHSDKKE
jgi:hypothetical protein